MPARDDATMQRPIDQRDLIAPPNAGLPSLQSLQQPVNDAIAVRLGITQGHVKLYEDRLEDASSGTTDMQVLAGSHGLKLKITW